MPLNRARIAQLLPHAGAMSLLDEMIACDVQQIVCRCDSHRRPDHPMRTEHGLGSASAVEYAAQAMALHAAMQARLSFAAEPDPEPDPELRVDPLTDPGSARAAPGAAVPHGLLASLRAVRLHVERLDDIGADLIVTARLDSGDARSALYEFAVTAEGLELVSGRATVLFVAPERTP